MTTGELHWVALAVFVWLFLFVTALGFVAARWKAGYLRLLDEWGLRGRRFVSPGISPAQEGSRC